MLSGAKHLQYVLENEEMQILGSAQDDSRRDFLAASSAPPIQLQRLGSLTNAAKH